MKRTRLLTTSLILVALSGCSGLYEQHMREICTPGGAYAEGTNDAHEGNRMQANFGGVCARYVPLTPTEQREIEQSYIEGYQFGLQDRLINKGLDIFGGAIKRH